MPVYYTLDEIINKTNKEIFISLNKNIHSSDLEYLKQTLIELNKPNIKEILYYDIAIYNILKN